ncbi:hypothetical protein QJS83_09090 [Bdellovibrio sp. 22V]|uniref:hypothetical protein n=1 Tax=Bdellovibrio TaxID=958 RepID=UPI0025429E5C|nr:hypothetical protein [Bdellovibrio sp. 22V]WII70611.1 hypothetical protein QJS83_09090 [Bdellovibrio sp. 22V]
MKKKTIISLAIVVAIILILSYCHFWKMEDAPAPVNMEAMGTVPSQGAPRSMPTPPPPDIVKEASPTATTAGFLPTEMEDPAKFEAYKKNLGAMAKCLNMEMAELDPQSEIGFDSLNKAISPDLGDIVAQHVEWTTTDIRTKAGEVRRIYLESRGGVGQEERRFLKYFAYTPSGEQKEISLSQEQMTGPTDALIASLEADGEIFGRAEARRIAYENGDDLLLVEKNGKIFSFDLSHDEKRFFCQGADVAATMNCECK